MESIADFCDVRIFPQPDQVEQIRRCFSLSQNVVREILKISQPSDPEALLLDKCLLTLKKFQNRSHHHLSRLAWETIIGTLDQYRYYCRRVQQEKVCKSNLFFNKFISKSGVCCVLPKQKGEALLLNSILLLPSLGTIPLASPWEHCFNQVTVLYIYQLGEQYRARVYSSWPFEKASPIQDKWLGLNLGKHKLVFLSDGRSFSFYHLLKRVKNQNILGEGAKILKHYDEIFNRIDHPNLSGIILWRSQIPTVPPQSLSMMERCAFLLYLLEKAAVAGVKVRVVSEIELQTRNDFEKAQAIRHAAGSQDIVDFRPLIESLQQNLRLGMRLESSCLKI